MVRDVEINFRWLFQNMIASSGDYKMQCVTMRVRWIVDMLIKTKRL